MAFPASLYSLESLLIAEGPMMWPYVIEYPCKPAETVAPLLHCPDN